MGNNLVNARYRAYKMFRGEIQEVEKVSFFDLLGVDPEPREDAHSELSAAKIFRPKPKHEVSLHGKA